MKNDQHTKTINILHLEDNSQDAELVTHFLDANGVHCFVSVVDNQKDYKTALKNKNLDIILADFTLPDLKGDEALQIALKKRPEIPFIFLSGTIEEEFAIECMKNGARDYVLKDRLHKLVPAINRAIKETRERTRRENLQAKMKESEKKFRSIFNSSPIGLISCQLQGNGQLTLSGVNPAANKILNCDNSQLYGKSIEQVFCLPKNSSIAESLKKAAVGGEVWLSDQFKYSSNGSARIFEVHAFQPSAGRVTIMFTDITDRKKTASDLEKTKNKLKESLRKLKKQQTKMLEMEKLKVVKELAGAVAHEFAQPLQALSNSISLIELKGHNTQYLNQCKEMVKRIFDLSGNLQHIVSLKRKDYLQMEIVDIKNSADQKHYEIKKILVVDDEYAVRQTLQELFLNAGYECDAAENGEEALRLIDSCEYDLILSDIMMPKMSGVKLFQNVRKMNYSTNFIFLTGYDILERDKKIIAEADGVFTKPVSFKELINQVNSLSVKKNTSSVIPEDTVGVISI